MKMTKKLFLGAVAVLAIAFSGCKIKEDADNAISGGSVDRNNTDTSKYYRCFQTRPSKHYDAVAKFEITQNTISSGSSSNGVSGFMFGVTKNDDNTYNFAVVSLRLNTSRKAEYYISYYKNVAGGDNLLTAYSNFCDKNGKVIGSTGCLATEEQIYPSSGSFALVSDYRYDSEVACLTVVVDQVKGAGTETDYATTGMRTPYNKGDYRVRIFGADRLGSNQMPATTGTGSNKHISATADVDKVITYSQAENVKNGQAAYIQKDLGYYFNIYPKNKLTSKIKFTDYTGNAIVEDEID